MAQVAKAQEAKPADRATASADSCGTPIQTRCRVRDDAPHGPHFIAHEQITRSVIGVNP